MAGLQSTRDLKLQVRTAADLPALLGAAYDLDGLVLLEEDLAPAYFDLRTGLLGDLFQTLVNHRLPAALVVADATAYGPRFTELAREHARHPQVRVVTTAEQARAWLEGMTGGHQ